MSSLRSSTRGFGEGFGGVLRGLRFVLDHPRLWTWIVLPLLLNVLAFAALAVAGWQLAALVAPDFAGQDWGWFDGLRRVLQPLLVGLLRLVGILTSLLLTLVVSGVINAPFYDLLSEKVELLARGRPLPELSWSEVLARAGRALLAAASLALRQAVIMALLLLLSFTAIGAPFYAAAGFFFTGYALADVTLARRDLDAQARMAWARRHVSLLLGLGLPVTFVPPLQPFGIVGATLLVLEG